MDCAERPISVSPMSQWNNPESTYSMLQPQDKIREIDVVLHGRGITLPPGCRYLKCRALLLRPRSAHQDLRAILHATLDVTQFHVIVTVFSADSQLWPTIVKFLSKEPQIPVQQAQGSWRDHQSEFFIGALLRYNGLAIIQAEPDWVAKINDRSVAIAAKRITSSSPRQLEKRVREARNQIDKQGLPGLILLDVSPLLPDYYNATSVSEPKELADATRTFLDDLLSRNRHQLIKAATSPNVMAITAVVIGLSIDPKTTARTMCLYMATKGLQPETGPLHDLLMSILPYLQRYELPNAVDQLLKSEMSPVSSEAAPSLPRAQLTHKERLLRMFQYEFQTGRLNEAEAYADELLKLATHDEDALYVSKALAAKGNVLEGRGHNEEALKLYQQAFALFDSDALTEESALIRICIAQAYGAKGEFDLAEAEFNQAIPILEKGTNVRYLALGYTALGIMYAASGRGPAQMTLSQALALGLSMKDSGITADACRGLSFFYALRQDDVREKKLRERSNLEQRASADLLRKSVEDVVSPEVGTKP